jgi:predicted enzyme related to lactoylglutathione lyase
VNRPVHFEIPADDLERSKTFWGSVFGWTFTQFGDYDYYLVQTGDGDGIDGGLMKRNPGQPVAVSMNVDNLDEMIAKVEAGGGTIVVPKRPIPGMGWLAYFTDPDGNIFGMMQPDPNAA